MDCMSEEVQIQLDEGYVQEVYVDSLGHATGGYGHLLSLGDLRLHPISSKLTVNQIVEWFKEDYEEAEHAVSIYLGSQAVPTPVRNVLINMAFNLGSKNLQEFVDMRKAIEEEDWEGMIDEMEDSRWYRMVGTRAERLIERIRMFRTVGSRYCNRPVIE